MFTESDKSGGVKRENRDNPNPYRVYDTEGVAPCLGTMGGGGREPHTIEIIGTLDPTRHSQMDILNPGGGVKYTRYLKRNQEGVCILV